MVGIVRLVLDKINRNAINMTEKEIDCDVDHTMTSVPTPFTAVASNVETYHSANK